MMRASVSGVSRRGDNESIRELSLSEEESWFLIFRAVKGRSEASNVRLLRGVKRRRGWSVPQIPACCVELPAARLPALRASFTIIVSARREILHCKARGEF